MIDFAMTFEIRGKDRRTFGLGGENHQPQLPAQGAWGLNHDMVRVRRL